MSSTEKRDALARDLANGVIAYGAGNADEYRADAERQVDGVVAEALRNAAERLRYLAPHTAAQDRAGLKLAAGQLMQDAAAMEKESDR